MSNGFLFSISSARPAFIAFELIECQPEPVEGGFFIVKRLRYRLNGTNDSYSKTHTFKLLESLRQRTDVEGGFFITQRLRQAQPDSLKKPNFVSFEKNIKNLLLVPQEDKKSISTSITPLFSGISFINFYYAIDYVFDS